MCGRHGSEESVVDAAAALKSGLWVHADLCGEERGPEDDRRLAAFKRGPFFLAKETCAPIVPMVITGTEMMMRKHSAAITPGVARVEFLEAIWPKDFATREELMDAVRAEMVEALPEEMRPEGRG